MVVMSDEVEVMLRWSACETLATRCSSRR